jgi:hypothetical protein
MAHLILIPSHSKNQWKEKLNIYFFSKKLGDLTVLISPQFIVPPLSDDEMILLNNEHMIGVYFSKRLIDISEADSSGTTKV